MPVYTRRWPPVVQQACCRHLTVVLVRRRQHTYILSCKVSSQYSQNTHDHTPRVRTIQIQPFTIQCAGGGHGGGAARRPPAVARGRAGGASVETGDEANKKQVTRYCRDQARCTYVFINIYTPHRIGRLLSSQSYTYALRITTTVVVALSISLAYTVSPLMSSGLQQPWAPARSPAKP